MGDIAVENSIRYIPLEVKGIGIQRLPRVVSPTRTQDMIILEG